jgi:hypothetical protein
MTSAGGEEEFYVSSSNRPFQFQAGNGKYVSQFFPGASGNGAATAPQVAAAQEPQAQQSDEATQQQFFSDRQQLGELRHTRDRLKLNLLTSPPSSSNGGNSGGGSGNGNSRVAPLCNPVKQGIDDEDKDNESEESGSEAEKMRLEDDVPIEKEKGQGTKPGEDVRLRSQSSRTTEQEVAATTAGSESHVKTSPSDGQRSSDGHELNSNHDDLDVK